MYGSNDMADAGFLGLAQEAAKEHDSCTNNLYNGLKDLGLELTEDPRYLYKYKAQALFHFLM